MFTDGLGGIIGQGLIGGLLGVGGGKVGFSFCKIGGVETLGGLATSEGLLIIASGILVSGLKIGGTEDWFWAVEEKLLGLGVSVFGSSPIQVGFTTGFTS